MYLMFDGPGLPNPGLHYRLLRSEARPLYSGLEIPCDQMELVILVFYDIKGRIFLGH